MYSYVVTAQKATAVTHSVTGNFTSSSDINLIIAKGTRLEIHTLTPTGLQPFLDVGIYGRISALRLFRPKSSEQDQLFILSERYRFCVLAFDTNKQAIVTKANGELQDRIGRPAEAGQMAVIDPDCRVIGLHLYDGLFKVIPMDPVTGKLEEAFNIRLEELRVIDIKFLHGCERPTIAVLYQDSKESRHIKTYQVLLREKEFEDGPWSQGNVEQGSNILIPIPEPHGGVLVIGELTIGYLNGSAGGTNVSKSIGMRNTIMVAYGKVDADGSRFLLGDYQGRLHIVVLQHSEGQIVELTLETLGHTSIATTLSYLDNGFVFVGSAFGDSQLIRLQPSADEAGNYVQVHDTFLNLGPIVDFCVVDLDRQGQGQIVTCSGAYKDGSLRIIRNGIGLNVAAAIELSAIRGLWALKKYEMDDYDSLLIAAQVGETRIFHVGEEWEEGSLGGFDSNLQSLFCGNVAHGQLLQITTRSVRLIAPGGEALVTEWQAPSGDITVASCNHGQVVVAVGVTLYYFEIEAGSLKPVAHTALPYEVSSVSIHPLGTDERAHATLCAVGLWTEMSVHLLRLPDLHAVGKEILGGDVIPRSLLLISFEGTDYLLCGMGDGHLLSFVLNAATYQLDDRKRVSLGTQPIALNTFSTKDSTSVFACSDRPTVIYSSNHKLLFSNVNLKEVSFMSKFHSAAFPDSLAIAGEGVLRIGNIDDIQKLHIRTVPLSEMPRRIAHQDSSKTFGLLAIRYEADAATNNEIEQHILHLIDDQTFEIKHSIELQTQEHGCSITSIRFESEQTDLFVVGTAFVLPNEPDPTRGRLLVFKVEDQKLVLVSERETKGAVFTSLGFNGKLLSTINNRVQLFKWESNELHESVHHLDYILALYAATRGDFIVVGDLIKSMSLLRYNPMPETLEEIARDYNPGWMTAIQVLDDETFIGAENSYNLFTLRKNSEAATEEERNRLESVGVFHVGELINKFQHGSLVMRTPDMEARPIPTLLYGTVNGSIGVIASLPQEEFEFFWRVQQAITKVIRGVGGFDHTFWRAFSNERKTAPCRNFVDGDLVESFLDLRREKMDEVAQAVGCSVTDLCKRIETLAQAIH